MMIKEMHRKYLSKLSIDLRRAVLRRAWELDGEDSLPRKPQTREEVAYAVESELASRADVKAPSDSLHLSLENGRNFESSQRESQPKRESKAAKRARKEEGQYALEDV